MRMPVHPTTLSSLTNAAETPFLRNIYRAMFLRQNIDHKWRFTMKTQKYYGWLDRFRLAAALLVITIHTSPLASLSQDADFFLTRVLARVAVPFFFMATGQFTLGPLFCSERAVTVCPPHLPAGSAQYVLKRCLLKLCALYGISVLLYLPLGIYAGHYRGISFAEVLKMVLFDGTFYHLWYFPACILGVLLVSLSGRFFSLPTATALSALLYVIGLLGDSYFGLADQVPFLHTAYQGMFRIFSYTRNGIFLAPLFLLLGVWAGKLYPAGGCPASILQQGMARQPSAFTAGMILALSFAAMTAEAFLLHLFGLQRHDSMYIFLVPAVFALYLLLLSLPKVPSRKALRTAALWIYILHPAFIVVVRGAAKVLHLTALLVENSLLHYLAVALLSAAAGFLLTCLQERLLKSGAVKAVLSRHAATHPASSAAHRAWIELDPDALIYNVRYLQSLLPEGCRMMPAVKANAYGHGAIPIAEELNRLEIRSFCVACASEGIELRKAGIKGEILILGYTPPEQLPLLQKYRLSQTIVDYAYAEILGQSRLRLHVHIAVDTGMHRVGIRCEDVEQIAAVYGFRNLTVDGIYTHLSACDSGSSESRSFTESQIAAFYRVTEALKAEGCPCRGAHLLSSYGILNYPEAAEDYVRPGIALYGLLSSDEDSLLSPLRPVLSLKARVVSVRTLHEGESAGYGLAFTAKCDMKLAVLSIGYADGLPRALSCGNGRVLIHGYSAPILGRICMDQTLVDVSAVPDGEITQGDTAVLIGRSGTQEITAGELADCCGTITNEILSRLGTRLERFFL